MSAHAHLLPRYKQLRQAGLALNNRLVATLSKDDIQEGAKKLGILRKNTIVLDTEDQTAVLMDFCLHDVYRGGMNALDRFLAESPPPADSDAMVVLKAKQQAWYSLFEMTGVEIGVGIELRDLLRNQTLFVVDVGFSQTGAPGARLASRMMVADGITMTTGAALPVVGFDPRSWEPFLQAVTAMFQGADLARLPPNTASTMTAKIISTCLKSGAAERIHYIDPGASIPNRPLAAPAARTGRNDPCPCGSGRKFKHCCGRPGSQRR